MQKSFRHKATVLLVLLSFINSAPTLARLEVCNQTDLVLMIAVGYDTTDNRTASEGWWRVYPGFCEVPVDVALLNGNYYVHAESNPRSTMPNDGFTWGEDKPLCVQLSDYRLPDGNRCNDDDVAIGFNVVKKNWRNTSKADIYLGKRSYKDQFAAQVAGVQRLLSILGFDVGEIDGVIGKKTVAALNQIGLNNQVFGFDFKSIFPVLENLIAQQQKLDN